MTVPPYLQTLTLLSHVQNVCDECSFTRPTSLISGTSNDQRQYVAVANRAVQKLKKEHAWPELQREYTFSLVSGVAAYALPSDFESILDDTVWDRDDYEKARGGLSARDWAMEKGSNLNVSLDSQWRIKGADGTQFHVTPTPTANGTANAMVLEYQSRNAIVATDNSTTKERFSVDSDKVLLNYTLFELALKWMLRKEKKLEYGDHKAEYDEELLKAKGNLIGAQPISMCRSRQSRPWPAIKPTGWGA